MDVIRQIKELQKQYETAQRELIEKILFRKNHDETGATFPIGNMINTVKICAV
jgi:hypothetical protein